MTRALLIAGVLALAPAPVSIDVLPRVLAVGGTIRLRCTVPRASENRQLDYGVEGYSSSSVPLDGEAAPVTRQVFIDHLPCGAGDAFCVVTRSDGRVARAVAGLTIAGCGDE